MPQVAEITNLVGRSQHSTIQLERPQQLAIPYRKSCEQFQSMAVPFNNNQPSLTRWPWAACHDLSEATGFSPTNPGSAGILDAGDPGDLGTPNLARWIPNMERIRWQWKKSLKKDGSQTSSTKIVLSYHDYIWLSCHLGMGETQVTRGMDGYKQKNHLERALAYPSHCKIYRRPLNSTNISCSI